MTLITTEFYLKQFNRRTWRQKGRRGLAYAGQRQEPEHGLLLRQAHHRRRDAEPHHRRHHRPQ